MPGAILANTCEHLQLSVFFALKSLWNHLEFFGHICTSSGHLVRRMAVWSHQMSFLVFLLRLIESHYSSDGMWYFCKWKNIHCGNLSSELLLLILLANGAPCPLVSVPLTTTFFLPHTGCQAVLTMNQSFGGFFDCRWGAEVTVVHSFRSLSAIPCALNNSLTYHFFSWVWEKSPCGVKFWSYITWLILKWAFGGITL